MGTVPANLMLGANLVMQKHSIQEEEDTLLHVATSL